MKRRSRRRSHAYKPKGMWRVLWGGTGQMSGPFDSKAEAIREVEAQREYDIRTRQQHVPGYVQTYEGDGMWRTVKAKLREV